MMIQVDGNWVNPDHIVSIVPDKRRGMKACEVHLTGGNFIRVDGQTPEQVAEHIRLETMEVL